MSTVSMRSGRGWVALNDSGSIFAVGPRLVRPRHCQKCGFWDPFCGPQGTEARHVEIVRLTGGVSVEQ